MSGPRFSVIVTIGERLALLRHFLAHYRRIGVQRFIFNYEFEEQPEIIDNVTATATQMGCDHVTGTVHHGQHYSRVAFANARRAWEQHGALDEWFLYPDLDEFYEVPQGLPALADSLAGEQLVLGTLIDRVAADGRLPSPETAACLEDVFPLGAHVTRDLMGAPVLNVALARGFGPISKHVHLCPIARTLRPAPEPIRIHHFKWTDSVTGVLERRAERYRAIGYPWWKESDTALQHLRANGGAFDLARIAAFPLGRVLGV